MDDHPTSAHLVGETRKHPLVALTGGIGAGKSTVAELLGRRGAQIVSADEIAREVVDPHTERGRAVLQAIAAEFGDEVLRIDGGLDRERVAARVFHDDDRRRIYNAIVHPAIREATAEVLADERRSGTVVHEIPLLTADTPPLPWTYDLVVTVEAEPAERVRRLMRARGYTSEHAWARIHAQGTEAGRRAIADVVIRTDGAMSETAHGVDALWAQIVATPRKTLSAD